ncbi:MAG: hypothetical protein WCB11_26825 [Terriglobales bacterium]
MAHGGKAVMDEMPKGRPPARQLTTLFRPVGLQELALIWDLGMREFPQRLPHQPIFYPVANVEYATQIARDWNTRDESSGFAGFVTRFATPTAYLAGFEPHTVGSSAHVEYWVPAEQLSEFNASIQGMISVESAYFGDGFRGYIPDEFGLNGKDAVSQFVMMSKMLDYSTVDFVCEVSANRKAVYLNFLFWAQLDFTPLGIEQTQRDAIIKKLGEAWDFNHVEIPLPLAKNP